MQLLICDQHVLFAESLAHLLTAQGHRATALTRRVDQLADVLRRESVDVCLLDMPTDANDAAHRFAELRARSPGTHLVLLTENVDAVVLETARAAGVRGVANKRRPAADILHLLDRVLAGESVMLTDNTLPLPVSAARHHGNHAQRLARFLTPREREALCGLVRGDDTTRIARSMGVTTNTVRCHIQNVLTKLGAHSRLEAATGAVRYGLVDPETADWLAQDSGVMRAAG
jgi:two-component system nitrate/nitrite response regulator NarL